MDTKKLRQKILDLAIHGKLVPQDPNDEPASVLLERIRAEKERLIAEGKIKRSKKSSASDTSHYENVPFDVPKGWCWVHLKDIASFGGGKTPSMENKEYWDNGTHLWVTSKDMKTSVINDSMMKISDEALKTMQVYQPGTLLMVTRSGILKRMLPLAILGKRATVNQDLKTISIVTPILPIYVFYTILANESMILRDYHKDGTTVDSINFDKFVEMSIPLPPQNEQKRIVDAIEHYLSLIEDIKHSEDDILVCIDSAKSKILDLAIHGKLVSQDANDEPASELLKRINPKAVASCDNPHYEQIPDGWCVCTLEDIVDYEQPQAYIVHSTDYSDLYKIPVLTAGKSFVIGYTNEQDGICNNIPVIIFDDFTTDSKYVDFPFKVKSSAMKILHVKDGINIKYVAYFMSITRLIGDTHKRYWISEYSKVTMPLPPKAEQDRIVNQIEGLMCSLDSIAETLV